jgi:hypothetical protein
MTAVGAAKAEGSACQRHGIWRLQLAALALLLLAGPTRAQITSASKGAAGGFCFVGPYGWTCDPSDFDSAAAGVQSITNAAAASASTATAQLANAPACSAQCVDGCTPPCPPACAAAKFEAQLARVPATTTQFFVDPWVVRVRGGGVDARARVRGFLCNNARARSRSCRRRAATARPARAPRRGRRFTARRPTFAGCAPSARPG